MTDRHRPLDDDADALRSAAERLHDDALDPTCAPRIPAALKAIDDALTTCSAAPVTPLHIPLSPWGARREHQRAAYARAAATWPSRRGGSGPSYEQQARVLSSLHDAGAAVRAAAGHCGRAAYNLAATMEPSAARFGERGRRRFGGRIADLRRRGSAESHAARARAIQRRHLAPEEPCRTSRTRSVPRRPFGSVTWTTSPERAPQSACPPVTPWSPRCARNRRRAGRSARTPCSGRLVIRDADRRAQPGGTVVRGSCRPRMPSGRAPRAVRYAPGRRPRPRRPPADRRFRSSRRTCAPHEAVAPARCDACCAAPRAHERARRSRPA